MTSQIPPGGLASVTDLDSSSFTYAVIAGENANYFTVDANTGEILTAVARINAEEISEFNLTVRVSDTDVPNLYIDVQCIIQVVDVNEFVPVCGSNDYSATVSEDAVAGTEVITITATDQDQGQYIEYSIKKQVYVNDSSSNELSTSVFTIDSTSGLITVGTALDYEKGSRILLDVCATDSGTPFRNTTTCSVTLVVIDVNDNSPVWVNTRSTNFYTTGYFCDGSVSDIYPVVTVEAIDNDASGTDFGTITYGFVESYESFEIDQATGQ